MKAIYAIAYVEAWKIQDFNRVWTRDFAILVRRSYQLSYKATDVGSWPFVGSKEPVSGMSWLECRTGIARSQVQAPLKSWIFQASTYAIA